jgi:hypothetical protein
MRQLSRAIAVLTALLIALIASPAVAGNAHFVGDANIVRNADNSLTVSGKVAGLGNEAQIHVTVTALAECINPGSKKPKAANKESVSAEGDFPVQNGKADYSLDLVATTISPNCSPPMTIRWSNVTITVDPHGLTQSYPGPF